jgi:propionate CoA-transferase
VTERAVFRLDPAGLRQIEVAPGVDIERDILPYMSFVPVISEVQTMTPSLWIRQRLWQTRTD